jgi:hypothetical protein
MAVLARVCFCRAGKKRELVLVPGNGIDRIPAFGNGCDRMLTDVASGVLAGRNCDSRASAALACKLH